ncbi:molybdopterin converting factor, subunit 1 [Candidatus Methylomirabilis lanthanidiphila]|uniref:Molybdopterin synthase sulfur carrier subunit n=1 Tax=Candidatus Methylomirabilis lanthanidiphila TaxID=2211376 RepID=A0A564ZIB4_9BACT|nr:MoaD/ThiS family protein [Candidatus Methylomirabilis lanthanidiphila]VUZ85045.1 molybdopterin converting factor, subunit 1 [Candidatus Methylomirabilis lanthanidiphila]
MKVRVRCFAAVREIVGASELVVDVPEGSTLNQLIRELCGQYPRLQVLTGSLLFSVNREYASTDTTLIAGDEIALIPPVSGGVDV